MFISARKHWILSCTLGGAALAVGAMLITNGTRQPAVAAQSTAGIEVTMITADAYHALERARTLTLQQDFAGAADVLAEAIDGLPPSGESSDYFFLRNAQLKTNAWAGAPHAAASGYVEWLATTPSEMLANEVVNTVILGMRRYDMLDAAALAAATNPAAAARIAVGRLEVSVARGEFNTLINSSALDEAGRLAADADNTRQLLFGLIGSVANRPGAPSPADVAESIANAVDPSLLDANFLLNWAAEAERDGKFDVAAKILATAEPLLVTATDDIRWNWSQANIAFEQDRLFEARQYSDVVKSLAHTKQIETTFAFATQAEILDDLIDRADIDGGGRGMSHLTATPEPGPIVVEPDPCEVVAEETDPIDGPVVDTPGDEAANP
ncbi:MAG: hypothetical protein ACKVS9_08845 [Phycisphaerae bacterium]